MVRLRQFVKLLVLLSPCAVALDESRLWLPVTYQTHYLQLIQAAAAADEVDRCVTLLEGTIDTEQSVPGHPIYRILCRQENGQSYNEMVDGLTYETLTTPKVVPVVMSADERERRRLKEEARLQEERQRHKHSLWLACQQALLERTALMANLKWLSDKEPEPITFDGTDAVYRVDFDAEDVWGKALYYRAVCTATPDNVELNLGKRR